MHMFLQTVFAIPFHASFQFDLLLGKLSATLFEGHATGHGWMRFPLSFLMIKRWKMGRFV